MITNVNRSNVADYKKYFAEIADALSTEDNTVEITSIEDVFEKMKEIRTQCPRFSRLPLDEEPFYINLDTRTIIVPANFSKNGISVKGDQVAETVYFKCSRYFDNVDLATKEIYIQYVNGNNEDKILKTPLVDIESEPGYIIFEWPITDKATAKAGTLRFAVRFCSFNEDGDKLTYSLATLTQTVKVNESINFDFTTGLSNENIEDGLDDLMLARLDAVNENLPTIGKASIPEFILGLKKDSICLGADDDGFTNQPIKVEVLAINDEGGFITYRIYKDGVCLNQDGSNNIIDFDIEYKPITETAPIEGVIYYKRNKDDDESVDLTFSGSITEFDNNYNYFKEIHSYKIDSAGKYRVSVDNRVRFTRTEEIFTPSTDEDGTENYLIIPKASEISIPESFLLHSQVENKLDATLESPDNKGKITYKWFKDDVEIEGAKLGEYTPEEEANYKVEITNYLNKTTTTVTSENSRVTKIPCKPILTYDANRQNETSKIVVYDYMNELPTEGFKVTANVADDAKRTSEDTVTYQWFKHVKGITERDNIDVPVSAPKAALGEYNIDKKDHNDIKLTEPTTDGNSYKPTYDKERPCYYCLITNKYNGFETVISSPFFRVDYE